MINRIREYLRPSPAEQLPTVYRYEATMWAAGFVLFFGFGISLGIFAMHMGWIK